MQSIVQSTTEYIIQSTIQPKIQAEMQSMTQSTITSIIVNPRNSHITMGVVAAYTCHSVAEVYTSHSSLSLLRRVLCLLT